MLKGRKVLLYLAALFGGATLYNGCLGLDGFAEGLFRRGFADAVWLDVLTDWLNEDLFS